MPDLSAKINQPQEQWHKKRQNYYVLINEVQMSGCLCDSSSATAFFTFSVIVIGIYYPLSLNMLY